MLRAVAFPPILPIQMAVVVALAFAILLQGAPGVATGAGSGASDASQPAPNGASIRSAAPDQRLHLHEGSTSAYLRHEHESPQVHLRQSARGGYATGVGWLAYASWDSSLYIAVQPSGVDQLSDPSCYFCWGLNSTISVGSDPFGVAVDPATKEVFVTNMGSDNVSVINGTTQRAIGNVSVQSNPEGIAFDPTDNSLFVADNGSDNVSVISVATLSVIATIAVGSIPAGVAWDNGSDRIFVTNRGSNNVSVISGGTNRVVGGVAVGSDPFGIADDNATGMLYVANEGSNNVSVISASPAALNATVPIATDFFEPPPHLQAVAYDSTHHMIWVTAGLTVVVIDAAAARAVDEVAFDPSGIAFDPDNGDVCETNSVNFSSGCFVYGASNLNREPSVKFSVQGLSAGVGWNVTLGTGASLVNQFSTGPNVTFGVDAGVIASAGCPCGYSYPYSASSAVVGSGPRTLRGNATNDTQGDENLTVTLTFDTSGEYGVGFRETGLPPSVNWGVNLSGTFEWSPSGRLAGFEAVNGSYSYTIGTVEGYIPSVYGGSISVNGSPVQVNLTWQALAVYPVTFNETGLPSLDHWSVSLAGTTESTAAGGTIGFREPNGSYGFTVGVVTGYRATPRSGSLAVDGLSTNSTIEFLREPIYAVFFSESGLPTGRTWTVNLSGALESNTVEGGSPSNLTFSEQNGSYSFGVSAVPGFTASPSSGQVTVDGAAALVELTFTTVAVGTFPVNFPESGLPPGTNWSVGLGATTQSASSSDVVFAEPNGSYPYLVNSPPGFTVSPSRGSIQVDGAVVTQALRFDTKLLPLSANFSFQIQYASCRIDGGVTNSVLLSGQAEGGTAPYSYDWSLPTGRASTALTSTTTTYGQNNTVRLNVSDSAGRTADSTFVLPMELPPCPPPPLPSNPANILPFDEWVILGLGGALVVASAAVVSLVIRGKRGDSGNR